MQNPSPEIPCILIGCTNSYLDPIRKDDLRQERHGVRRLWNQEEGLHPLVEMASPGRKRYFFDLIRKHNYDENLHILHLAGYGIGNELHFEGGMGLEMVTAEGFAQMIDKLPALKFVYLNGCASIDIMEQLFRKDIPAIFATRATQDRSALHIIARRFYQHMSTGVPLGAAFDLMRNSVQLPFVHETVSYDLDEDRFVWESRDTESFTAGLFIQEDHQEIFDWYMPSNEGGVGADDEAVVAHPTTKSKGRLSRFLGLG